jgi:hypothetical protein
MRAVIRLAVCLIMAASSTATFAEEDEATSAGADPQSVKEQTSRTDTNAKAEGDEKDAADVGAASGEPTRSDARDTAARDYDQQLRQTEIWTSP